MSDYMRRMSIAAAAAVLAGGTGVRAADLAQDAKIQALETKVATLEAQQAQNTKDLASTIDGVLRDAQQRSQFLATSGDTGAGYDNGFYIQSGEWMLRPGAVFQFRNNTDYRKNVAQSPAGDKDEVENGFEIRRMQFILQGTAFTKDLAYFFKWNTKQDDGSMYLEDAWAKYMFADQWGFRVGQFKDPVTHEKLMGDNSVMAVDRSLLDATLGGGFEDRTQGATLVYGGYDKNNPVNAEFGITDGINQDNTNFVGFTGAPVNSPHSVDFGLVGRVEFKAMGDWKNYSDFTARGTKEDLLVFGLGGDWSQQGDGDSLVGTLDAQWENSSGWAVYAAGIVRNLNKELTGLSSDATDWGAMAQVSYLCSAQWELFGRYTYINFDNEIASAGNEDTFHEISLGVNYYMGKDGSAGHRAKVTVDINWLPNGAPGSLTSYGYEGDSRGEDEIAIRGQFQLMI